MKSTNINSATGRSPVAGGADRGADEGALGDRRVEHALAAELRIQTLGHAHRTPPQAHPRRRRSPGRRHVLAHHDDACDRARISWHRLVDRLAE
jgi:hypothetical protein